MSTTYITNIMYNYEGSPDFQFKLAKQIFDGAARNYNMNPQKLLDLFAWACLFTVNKNALMFFGDRHVGKHVYDKAYTKGALRVVEASFSAIEKPSPKNAHPVQDGINEVLSFGNYKVTVSELYQYTKKYFDFKSLDIDTKALDIKKITTDTGRSKQIFADNKITITDVQLNLHKSSALYTGLEDLFKDVNTWKANGYKFDLAEEDLLNHPQFKSTISSAYINATTLLFALWPASRKIVDKILTKKNVSYYDANFDFSLFIDITKDKSQLNKYQVYFNFLSNKYRDYKLVSQIDFEIDATGRIITTIKSSWVFGVQFKSVSELGNNKKQILSNICGLLGNLATTAIYWYNELQPIISQIN